MDNSVVVEVIIGNFTGFTIGVERGYSRNIWDFLNLNVPLRFAVVNFNEPGYNNVTGDIGALLQAQLWNRNSQFVPYVTTGVNGVYEFKQDQQFGLQIPGGLGIDIKVG